MRRTPPDERRLMRIGELAEATGVSVQTIHYYLRDGLLPLPLKTAPNMAYYGPEYIEEIQLIKELQQKRYLPLAMIKVVLQAKREGQDVSHLREMRLTIEDFFRPLGPEESPEPVALIELVAVSGLPVATIEALEGMGLLTAANTPEGKRYDGIDIQIAKAVKTLLDLGLAPSDLRCYTQYVEALRLEVEVMHEKLHHHAGNATRISLVEVRAVLDTIKTCLMTKVYRQAVLALHSNEDER